MDVQVKKTVEVTLTLSEYEALFLQEVMARVGGPGLGARALAYELHRKLYELDLNPDVFTEIGEGSIYFK